jgi:hypothetical protein
VAGDSEEAQTQEERLALNEAMFRAGNERMAQWEERHFGEEFEEYFCECADVECREKIKLTFTDYERVRRNSVHFLVVSGHELPDIETVIEEREGWSIIEKNPEVQAIVEATDLRHPYGRQGI